MRGVGREEEVISQFVWRMGAVRRGEEVVGSSSWGRGRCNACRIDLGFRLWSLLVAQRYMSSCAGVVLCCVACVALYTALCCVACVV